MQNAVRHSSKGVYQQTAEMIFGLVASGFLLACIGLLIAAPLWMSGNAQYIVSVGFNVALFVATSVVFALFVVKFWANAAGFCVGLLTGLMLSGAAFFLGPLR